MSRVRARRRLGFALAPAALSLLAFAACEEKQDDDNPRYYYPPDANDEDVTRSDGNGGDATGDASTTDADAGADADAGGGLVRALATGSGAHLDPAAGGGGHTCVVLGAARSLYCWGANDYGQIGNGKTGGATTAEDVASAVKIGLDETGLPFDGVDEISLGSFHSCARRGDVVFCWGQRHTGAQAEPPATNTDRTAPRAIGNLDGRRIAAGGPHSCTLKTNGKITCFGHSTFNELGRANADDLACTAGFFYDYNGSATHVCSGSLLDTMFGALPGASAVVAGETHSCALASGKVHCWGAAGSGELGRPVAQAQELNAQIVVTDQVALTALDGVTAVANEGARHTCAIQNAGATVGQVVCWGVNDVGQVGASAATPARPFAGVVPGLAGVTAIGVGPSVSCAVKADATVACWGNDLAALGDGGAGSSPAPVPIKGPLGVGLLGNVAAVAPGARHVCALKKDGTVWCWGKNDRGQLGDGTKVDSAYPVKVVGLPPP